MSTQNMRDFKASLKEFITDYFCCNIKEINQNNEVWVISDNGSLFDFYFDSKAEAEIWVSENWSDDEDLYLIKYHQMSLLAYFGLQTIEMYAGCESSEVLEAIYQEENSDSILEMLGTLDENHFGKEYFNYYIGQKFGIKTYIPSEPWGGFPTPPDEDDCPDFEEPKLYKDYIIDKLVHTLEFVGQELMDSKKRSMSK